MLFFDPLFVFVFLPITLLGARILQSSTHATLLWLIAASIVFYSYDDPRYTLILLVSIAGNAFFASGIQKSVPGMLTAGVVANLALLGWFKYAGFFAENLALVGVPVNVDLDFVLPLGISFYTFQQIAYLVDLKKGITREHRLTDYSLFVSFFPQLIAGPIVHHREIVPQFPHIAVTWASVATGSVVFAIGVLKKLLIADHLAPLVSAGHADVGALSGLDAWITSLAYTFQLYFDFSGYADMAIGLALMFGLLLPVNFDAPYKAASIQDFWRRWHMTLSRWLRDYLFIPLGGSRGTLAFTLRNLFLTFLLGGLWHGAAWTFILWGALHGTAIALHRAWNAAGLRMPPPLAWLATFLFVNAAWVFFRAGSVGDALAILRAMADLSVWQARVFAGDRSADAVLWVGLAAAVAFFAPTTQVLAKMKRLRPRAATGILVALALLAIYERTIQGEPSPFLYFNF